MSFELQPRLENEWVRLEPLKADDFDALYVVASDPLIWEQHPNKDRYRREVFENYFKGALESGGAFCVFNRVTGELLGSSRYYDFDARQRLVYVGYTFIARNVWGCRYNHAMKSLMLNHAFRFVDRVMFHVGIANQRSRKAMEKLGATFLGEMPVNYYGEPGSTNAIYAIDKAVWNASSRPVPAL